MLVITTWKSVSFYHFFLWFCFDATDGRSSYHLRKISLVVDPLYLYWNIIASSSPRFVFKRRKESHFWMFDLFGVIRKNDFSTHLLKAFVQRICSTHLFNASPHCLDIFWVGYSNTAKCFEYFEICLLDPLSSGNEHRQLFTAVMITSRHSFFQAVIWAILFIHQFQKSMLKINVLFLHYRSWLCSCFNLNDDTHLTIF